MKRKGCKKKIKWKKNSDSNSSCCQWASRRLKLQRPRKPLAAVRKKREFGCCTLSLSREASVSCTSAPTANNPRRGAFKGGLLRQNISLTAQLSSCLWAAGSSCIVPSEVRLLYSPLVERRLMKRGLKNINNQHKTSRCSISVGTKCVLVALCCWDYNIKVIQRLKLKK